MIKDLTLTLDLYETIIPRIIDISLGGEVWFSLDVDESKSDYERFIINENLAKPSLKRIEEEFQEYKNELLSQKYQEMRADWEYIKDPRLAMTALNINVSNPELYFLELFENEDSVALTALVDAYDAEVIKQNEIKARQDKKDIGQKVRSMCDSALDVIIGYNVTRTLTPAQQNEMKTIYADIFQALKDYQPATAKALIQAVTVDGTLTTQSMKDDVLKEL